MGADGWLGIGWPKEYGGQGRGVLDQFVFFDEVQRANAPFPFVTVNTVGPGAHGARHRRAEAALPARASSPARSTSPSATPSPRPAPTSRRCARRAVLDGDEWVINGNKVFTSGANQADYVWLACRTDPEAPKHKGISIIIVPTASPGFTTTPIVTVGSVVTQATYYDDIRVPEGQRRRRGQRRLAADHQPAQPRAGRPRRARRADPPPLRRRRRVVPHHRRRPTAPAAR